MNHGGPLDPAVRYSRDQLVERFGEPIVTHVPEHPRYGVTELLVFACTCRAVKAGDAYSVVPCEQHGGRDVLRLSDRRTMTFAVYELDFEATGVLAMLIARQAGVERDEAGCVDLAFAPELLEPFPLSVQALTAAGLLRTDADGMYRLVYFTCFDSETQEWY